MRRGNKPEWIYLPSGDLAGIALGSDWCAEHEWGVGKMKYLFKCDETQDGIARRQINSLPTYLRRFSGECPHFYDKRRKSRPYDALFLSPTESYYRAAEEWVKDQELSPAEDRSLACAWDEGTFGIVAYGEKDRKNLEILWDAFQRKDVAFWPNLGVFHTGGGLIFCIVSKVPEKDVKQQLADDLDYKELLKQSEGTGIQKELEAAGKTWLSLSPRWATTIKSTGDREIKTKFPVIYWLNPREQDIHNYGWWTVEDLKLWAQNKGPVMMTEKQRRERGR